MAFTIRNMFSSGDTPEGGAAFNAHPGQEAPPQGFGASPFAMAGGASDGARMDAPTNLGGFVNPGVPVFKPISEEPFRTGALEARPSGGGSPFLSMGDQAPQLVVADILPSLPPDVARGNGAPMDQAVHLAPAIIEAAKQDGSHSVALFEVFRVCPALFQVPVSPADPRRVRIPKLAGPSSASAAPAPAVPAPSPFAMAAQPPSPSPFAAMQSHSPTMMPPHEQPAPSSRPIGTLPPRRPEGVPPAIPTQNDFAVAPTLQLPGAPAMQGSRELAAPSGESPFAMAFSAQPTSPAPSNFIPPPKPEMPEMQPFAAGSSSPFAESAAPSPFLGQSSMPPASPSPKSVPMGGVFNQPPPSRGSAQTAMPSPFGTSMTPPASPPPPLAQEPAAPMFGAGGPSPFASFSPEAPMAPEASAARAPSRPLSAVPASRPMSMPPPDMPPGLGETVEMPLSSIVKGHSPQDLGFDPNFIPAWIMTKLPAYLVKQQTGAAEIRVELGAVIDGTDETFRPIISHGKRDYKVRLPHNEVFHALPQVSSPAAQPTPPPAQPATVGSSSPAPVQPVGLQGLTSAFALGTFGASTRGQDAPPAPPSRPFFNPTPEPSAASASPAGWQSVAAPAPLFGAAPPAPATGFGAPPAMSLPVPPMPEIQQPVASPEPFAPVMHGSLGAKPEAPSAFLAPASTPAPAAPPVPLGISAAMGDREQMMLRALLGVAGHLTRDTVVQHVARLSGVEACVFVSGQQVIQHGAQSAPASEFMRQGVDLSRSLKTLAAAVGIGEAETLSVNSDSRLVTFSFHETAALGILHSDRESASGLKEKVALICRELAAMPA